MAKKKPRKPAREATPVVVDNPSTVGQAVPTLAHLAGITVLSNVVQARPEWLVDQRIPLHQVVLVEGKKECGKSTYVAAVAAAMTGGPVVPEWIKRPPRPVVWIGSEEGTSGPIRGRLEAAQADLGLCCVPDLRGPTGQHRRLTLPSMIGELRDLLRATSAGLLVLDPYSSLADADLDLRQEQPARSYLEPLADLMWETQCTAVLVRHLKKGSGGDALDQGLGSAAVGNTVRSILRVAPDPEDSGCQCLTVVACNQAKGRPASLLFSFADKGDYAAINWKGKSKVDADLLAEGKSDTMSRYNLRQARTLLRAALAGGPQLVTIVAREALEAGISWHYIQRACQELDIHSHRDSIGRDGAGSWSLQPPPNGFPPLPAPE